MDKQLNSKLKFKGIFTALLTPFCSDGTINRIALEKLMNFNIKCGVNGFYVGGSTGEGVLLDTETRKELFVAVSEINRGRVTLIGHVGSTATAESEILSKICKDNGYDAVSAVPPFYYGHSFEAIKEFYNDIARASSLPVIIYNFPLSGNFNLTKEALSQLLENKQIVGIKHTSQDFFALQQFKTLSESPIVFNGYDEMLSAGLIMGADGGIGSTYNFMPHKIVKLFNLFKEGKIDEVMKLQIEINDIIAIVLSAGKRSGLMNVEKAILEEMGIEMGASKKPFLPLNEEDRNIIKPLAKKLFEEVGNLI